MGKKRRVADDHVATDSPASKRLRPSDDEYVSSSTRGRRSETPDLVGADKALHEELVEAGAIDEDADLTPRDRTIQLAHVGGDDDDDEVSAVSLRPARQRAPADGYQDLYLDTINRKALDFDFEKLCSVTLSNINVYACLVCGKYFQGRGTKSPAYFHALNDAHHVYINLESKSIYVLPDGYEVHSKSLDDIKFVLDPKFTKDQVLTLDRPLLSRHNSRSDLAGSGLETLDLEGRRYVPGFVGMNNIKANDYVNVIVQVLSHVSPLRNFLLLEPMSHRPQLLHRFGTLVRKIWNPRAFKSHVSPHELLQEIALRSSKRFNLTTQSDPVEFTQWFLNALHSALGGSTSTTKSKFKPSIVSSVFRGTLMIESQEITAHDSGDRWTYTNAPIQVTTSPFMILTLDLPPVPLFQDGTERNIIPQVPLMTLLGKYNGSTTTEAANHRKRYRLQHPLPPYLLFHVKRFTNNKFLPSERKPTIVTFPSTTIDLAPLVATSNDYPSSEPIFYDLVANVTLEAVKLREDAVEGEAEKREWRVQMLDKRTSNWWEIQDLWVAKRDLIDAESLFARESYFMVWERRRKKA